MEIILKEITVNIYANNKEVELDFSRNEHQNQYEYSDGEDFIIIKVSKDEFGENQYSRIDNSNFLVSNTAEIEDRFLEELTKKNELKIESENIGVEYGTEEEPDITIPYNPNSIKIQSARFTLREIYEMITGTEDFEKMLDLSPDFQRNYVWDITRKSRLIESILLQIPLPVIYLSRDLEGKYQVVDGVQRLSVIEEFFSNNFRLVNLEYLKQECEGKFYSKNKENSLHMKFVRQLRTYQIDCNVIEPSTPIDVKFDIFKRLNTGGKTLNNQEIRNSMMVPAVRNFIRELAKSDEFKKATNYKIKPKRMHDQEFILRYIAFYLLYTEIFLNVTYKGNIHTFLNSVVELMNENAESFPYLEIEKRFKEGMLNTYSLFGKYAFKKLEIAEDYKFKQNNDNKLINKSLFTAFSVLLSNVNFEKRDLTKAFARYLEKEKYLYECITYGTSNETRIDTTFLLIDKFLDNELGEEYAKKHIY